MRYIDMHCDTLMEAFFAKKETAYEMSHTMVDVKRLRQADALAQFFAVFLPCDDIWDWFKTEKVSDEEYMRACERIFAETLKKYPNEIAFAGNARDVEENERQGKLSALLTIEDGRPVQGSMEKLEEFYARGYRLISLTWNFKNCFGSPNSREEQIMKEGLTTFGKEAVPRMNELGMLVDVSHLSDGGFYDVASISKKPFVASHSNCRELCSHPRNLTDEMIRILADKGGVMGLNFAPEFLDDTKGNEESRIDDMVRHVKHVVRIGGIETAAIGTDFDGIEGKLEVDNPTKMELLFDRLSKEGFSGSDLDKISRLNVLRVMKDSLA